MILTVGPNKNPFNIHEALLKLKTSFFEIHHEPNGHTIDVKNKVSEPDVSFKKESSPTSNNTEPSIGIATSNGSCDVHDTSATTLEDTNGPKVITADYHLDTHFVKAFGIFVEWLYNVPPQVPKTASHCKILIQAYLLALKYRATGLQNLLLDCVRHYHVEHRVNFDLLFIYLLNRHGDDVECKLIKYFVDQIAYEIADSGVADFDTANAGFEFFMRDRREGKVRTALVHALGEIAAAAKSGGKIVDPANALDHDYYV